MATSMPVIASKHAGIPELVIDNVNGFLTEERNINDIALKMIKLIENPDLWIKFGKTRVKVR